MSGQFQNIVVTGATGGIGGALALRLAKPGRAFLLFGRDGARLSALASEVENRGAVVASAQGEIEDSARLDTAIAAFDAEYPIKLVLTCAACKYGNAAGIEDSSELRRVIDVNVTGTMETVQACLRHMGPRGHGQIALFSSLAAMSPQPDLLSYSASKAATSAYATALRRNLRRSGISVSLVLPGFVDTEMTRRHKGPTPLLMNTDAAARIILRGLERRQRTIAFPKRLALLSWLEGLAPPFLADAIHDRLRAEIVSEKGAASIDKTK